MRALLDTFWAPKYGNSLEEYEDAFAPPSGGEFHGTRLRFAVADGATEAAFARVWARLLVQGYMKGWIGGRTSETSDRLARLGRIWQRRVGRVPLPWYGEEKRRQGAFAAVLGLEISAPEGGDSLSIGSPPPGGQAPDSPARGGCPDTALRSSTLRRTSDVAGTWRSYAAGDCCLFHLRGDRLLGSFPVEDPEDFGSRPVLLSSNVARNASALASAASAWGDWAAGDVFYLMSDALACWFLTEHRSGALPWQEARDLGGGAGGAEAEFGDWISRLRTERGLRNDDVTLLRITLSAGPPGGHSGV